GFAVRNGTRNIGDTSRLRYIFIDVPHEGIDAEGWDIMELPKTPLATTLLPKSDYMTGLEPFGDHLPRIKIIGRTGRRFPKYYLNSIKGELVGLPWLWLHEADRYPLLHKFIASELLKSNSECLLFNLAKKFFIIKYCTHEFDQRSAFNLNNIYKKI
ncbi:MAG: hypothetical protein MUD10_03135, partial [Candidatus Pacebacteria bacterium]|nr:hypothetical protein [Candidatus Paceibacterota bacterium]